MTEISKEQMLHRLKVLRIYCRGNHFECGACKLDVECDAIEALIESSVKITTVGGGLFSHYPQGRAKQTEGSESSGEPPCATVPKLSITHGDDGYWLCIDSPSGKHAGIHLEKRPEMTIVNAVLAEVAIELAGGEQEDPKAPGPTVEPGPCKSTEEGSTPSPGSKSAPKVEPEVDNSGHPQAKERREMAEAIDEAMEIWGGTPPAFYSPDDIRPWRKIRALLLSPAPPTDEERRGMLSFFNGLQGFHATEYSATVGSPSGPVADAIRRLLLSPAKEGVSVSREWAEKWAEKWADYIRREWPFYSAVHGENREQDGLARLLLAIAKDELGIRVVEPSEAEDSEEGKEPK